MGVNLIFKIAAVGILVSVICQVLKHSGREEQAFLTSLAGLILVLFWMVPYIYGAARLESIVEGMRRLQEYVKIRPVFLNTLVKMTGITYIVEFSSGICRDAGYGAVGTQIEIFGKLSILAVSMPVVLALMETLQGFLG